MSRAFHLSQCAFTREPSTHGKRHKPCSKEIVQIAGVQVCSRHKRIIEQLQAEDLKVPMADPALEVSIV